MSGRFAGLRVLVTGAAGGIGGTAARAFRDEGATVVASDLLPPDPSLSIGDLRFLPADVTDAAAVAGMVAAAAEPEGRIDVLVHAAAILGGSGPFETVAPEVFARYMEVNLMGTVHVAQAVARRMIASGTKGSIITFGSVNSLSAEANASPYVASKGAVRLLTRAMAVDLARHGIRANIILPGPVTVARNAEWFSRPEVAEAFGRVVPMGRAGEPAELVAALFYLADPRSTYTTGTDVVVDGGLMAQLPLP
jgi:NAD(P)-dependent dehydrogenase (short-subunit alcohol dehydrogenase family)